MKILGIESSCDETAVAVVENGVRLCSSTVFSSQSLHQQTQGIVPEVAARAQIEEIIPVLSAVMKTQVGVELAAFAVTVGPGLIGSLLIGVETARVLSYVWQKPLLAVNHLLAHLYANWLTESQPVLPAVALIVSGGHTELVYLRDHGDYEWLGGTRDDAAGEAFDKVARLLDLPYPGGPSIQETALEGKRNAIDFPRPMLGSADFDFSFSGLKTAVRTYIQENPRANIADVAASFQEAVAEVLVKKTLSAVKEKGANTILLAGGVAANQRLREMLGEYAVNKYKLCIPPVALCTDNAAYIASCAYFNQNVVSWEHIKTNPSLSL